MPWTLQQYLTSLQQSAPATVIPAASTPRSTAAPSPDAVARIQSGDPVKEIYTIQTSNVIEDCFGHVQLIEGLIYVCASVSNGVLQPAAATAYIGRTAQHLTEVRNVGDENVPVLISASYDQAAQPGRTYVRGTAGDTLVLIYRPT